MASLKEIPGLEQKTSATFMVSWFRAEDHKQPLRPYDFTYFKPSNKVQKSH